MRADVTILMHRSEPTKDRPVTDMDVPSQRTIIGKYRLVPNNAVMRDMNVSHYPIVVAHSGHPSILDSATIDRAILPDRVSIANNKARGFPGVLLVLRVVANRIEKEKGNLGGRFLMD